jgi:excisionase family DNA binding protein
MIDSFERPMGVAEAAAFTGLSPNYIYKLIHLRKIPCYKPTGGRVFFKREELEEFVFRGRTAADYEISEKADSILNGNSAARGFEK